MVFPLTPRNVHVELFLNGTWVDISSDVYARDGITISRGRRDEQARAEPSACQLTINNRSGNYSPRNPVGLYYGSIGRNTPIRVSIELAADSFTRTVSNGWGTSTSGATYTLIGSGGTVQNSDFNVNGTRGTLSIPVASANRAALVTGLSLLDADLSSFGTLPFSQPTPAGTTVYPVSLIFRYQTSSDYVYAYATVDNGRSIHVGVNHINGTVIVAPTLIPGGSFSFLSANGVNLRAQAEGDTYRVKGWIGNTTEPYSWTATGASSISPQAGQVGVNAWISTGATNTFPVIASIDNLSVRVPRFFGEVASWPQRWDTSGTDFFVPIEGAGIRRRLSQGTTPQHSTLYRYLTSLATAPVAYWPCEDGPLADSIASAVGGPPMVITDATTEFANYSDLAASAPLPLIHSARWTGQIPAYPPTNFIEFTAVIVIPSGGLRKNTDCLWRLLTSGTAGLWQLSYTAPDTTTTPTIPGSLTLSVYTGVGGSLITDFGPAFTPDGQKLFTQLRLTQSGTNVVYSLTVVQIDGDSTVLFQAPGPSPSGTTNITITGQTIGIATTVLVNRFNDADGMVVGHLTVRRELSSDGNATDYYPALTAMTRETAGNRISRLCGDNDITLTNKGDLTQTTVVGPQRVLALVDLLDEAADADLGSLYEPRGDLGFAYRTRADVYNQTPVLAVNYSSRHLVAPLEPVDDDQLLRNDITVAQTDGSSVKDQLITGRLSVNDAALGGAGRYDTQYTVNVAAANQLADIAGWLLALGTVDEPRYPSVTINLATQYVVSAGLEPSILAVNIDDRITIDDLPAVQGPDLVSQIVRGYVETIKVFEHTISFVCAPESPYEVAQLDTTPACKLGSSAPTLAVGVSSTATSLSVASTGALWTTSYLPISIVIAGEEITVTSISGSASPQTFTVTRSVNGVVKSQSAGVPVYLKRSSRAVLAL